MPYRKIYRRRPRKPVRRVPRRGRAIYRKKRTGPARPAVHRFKRTQQELLQLQTTSGQAPWVINGNGLTRQFTFKLNDLDDHTDFTSLFTSYRLKGCRVQAYLATPSGAGEINAMNMNILAQWVNNWDGQTHTLSNSYFNQRQARKLKSIMNRPGGKAFDIYMPLRQLTNVWSGSIASNDYGTMKPKWISTNEVETPHFGVNMRLDRVDGATFGLGPTSFNQLRFFITYYLECRGVS